MGPPLCLPQTEAGLSGNAWAIKSDERGIPGLGLEIGVEGDGSEVSGLRGYVFKSKRVRTQPELQDLLSGLVLGHKETTAVGK